MKKSYLISFSSFLKSLGLIAFLILVNTATFAQDGANDPTFNPEDLGFGNGANGGVNSISIQSDGKIVFGGSFTHYIGTATNRIARINANGTLDETFIVGMGANFSVYATAIQSDGKIIIGGIFTSYNGTEVSRIARLNANGTLDQTFVVGSGASGTIRTIAIQNDGKIIIGGTFTSYNGTARNRIARLNADGSLDETFTIGTGANNSVYATAIQSDGKIIIGGNFTLYNGTATNRIARLNADGSLDETFTIGTGANNSVYATTIQSNGKIIIGGNFTTYNGMVKNSIVRLNTDGSLDEAFVTGSGINGTVLSIAIQIDGRIIIGGGFDRYNEVVRTNIVRLNTDGTLDETFAQGGIGAYSTVNSIAPLSIGRIIIGGGFEYYNGTVADYIACLNTDGTLNGTFNPMTGANGDVSAIAIQSDGKIIIGGWFTSFNGVAKGGIARLNIDGTLDETFNMGVGFDGIVLTIAIQSDGRIIIGGFFNSYNGTEVNSIARLTADGILDNSFTLGTGANDYILTTTIQSDGKIIIGGNFTLYNGTAINRIARLNADGTLDNSFIVGEGADDYVRSIAPQSDGKIIIGGYFTSYNGTAMGGIARLNADGTLDETFTVGTGANSVVRTISIQGDGRIIIGGFFTSYNGTAISCFARLNADGSLDETFALGVGANFGGVRKISIQSDGKILIVGDFTTYNETSINHIARLNSDGTLDETFAVGTGANDVVNTFAFQNDGKIIIGGWFKAYNGAGRNRIARLLNTIGTSIPQVDEREVEFAVYPNPTEGNAFIDMGEYCQSANVEVFDICGKLVMQKQYNDTQILDIDITAPAGIYFITISTANKRETLKLIKN